MTRTLRNIVIATSLAEADDQVVKVGLEIADKCGADVLLAHAYVLPMPYAGVTPSEVMIQTDHEPVERLSRQNLVDQLQRVGGDVNLAEKARLDIGSAHRVILEAANECSADLILVGPHSGSRTAARWLGSTADRVLRQALVPVWIVRDSVYPPKRALAPVDLSDLSRHCLERGLEVLREASPELPEVEALFILSRVDREGSVNFTPDQVDRFASEELERFASELRKPEGLQLNSRMKVGLPREEIQRDLDQHPVDLVILGTHGRSGFERLMLGSVSADIVREATCSVLVVPPVLARVEAEDRALDSVGDKQSKRVMISEAFGPASRQADPSFT